MPQKIILTRHLSVGTKILNTDPHPDIRIKTIEHN